MEINNENNGLKVEINHESQTDLTKVVEEAYHDGGKNIIKELGQVGETVLGFINNTLGVPFQLYNTWAKPRIEQVKRNIENRMHNIPPQNLTTPPMNVLLPAIDGLKYNLDEDILKEKFENLIVNSCNSDYSNTIHPKYAQILTQLSSTDALLLKDLSNFTLEGFPIANIIIKKDAKYMLLFPNCFYSEKLESWKVSSSVDNLVALGILQVDYSHFIDNEKKYENILNTEAYRIFFNQEHGNISLQKGILSVTSFGRNFIKICI